MGLPPKQGLYDPRNEHDSCGVGFVANIKGHGSLSQPRPVAKGKASKDYLGSLSFVDVPDAAQLAKHTTTANTNNRMAASLDLEAQLRAVIAEVPTEIVEPPAPPGVADVFAGDLDVA